jgi:2-polyprenyl-6-hydroxyphenyl methylase/3-demethylubiquinone-9 3-methyltransferase
MVTTADQREIDNFAALSDQWWDMRGPMATLHAFTPIRIDYILAHVERFWPRKARSAATASRPLTGLRILDIGCGGGLLAEPIAQLGAKVTGIDITEAAVMAAIAHAKQVGLDINYSCCTAEELASTGETFDVIYASEVIEHVADRGLFIKAITRMLDPKGVVIVTTINRSLAALILAKFALEYVVRLVPVGTHDPKKFVKPDELRQEFAAEGILLDDMTGLTLKPDGDFRQTGCLAINYAASGGFI